MVRPAVGHCASHIGAPRHYMVASCNSHYWNYRTAGYHGRCVPDNMLRFMENRIWEVVDMTFIGKSFIISRHLVQKLGWRRGLPIIVRSAWTILRIVLFHPHTQLSFKRNLACWKCEMYSTDYGTCGRSGEVFTDASGVVHRLGCWCIIELANRLPSKRCWARSSGLTIGWPDELLPKD